MQTLQRMAEACGITIMSANTVAAIKRMERMPLVCASARHIVANVHEMSSGGRAGQVLVPLLPDLADQ